MNTRTWYGASLVLLAEKYVGFHILPNLEKLRHSLHEKKVSITFLFCDFQGGWTALTWACYKGRTEVAQELLDRSANPNVKGEVSIISCLYFFVLS